MNLDIFGGTGGFFPVSQGPLQGTAGVTPVMGVRGRLLTVNPIPVNPTDIAGGGFPSFLSLLSSEQTLGGMNTEGLSLLPVGTGDNGKGVGDKKGVEIASEGAVSLLLGVMSGSKGVTSVEGEEHLVDMNGKAVVRLQPDGEAGPLYGDKSQGGEGISEIPRAELSLSEGNPGLQVPGVSAYGKDIQIQSDKDDGSQSGTPTNQLPLVQGEMENFTVFDETGKKIIALEQEEPGGVSEEGMDKGNETAGKDHHLSIDGPDDILSHHERPAQSSLVKETLQQSGSLRKDDGDGIPLPKTVKVSPERIEMHLKPEGLGRIDLSVGMKDGHLNAHIGVERVQSLIEIQENISQLFASLSAEGWGSGSFSFHLKDEGKNGYHAGRGETPALEKTDQPSQRVVSGILSIRV